MRMILYLLVSSYFLVTTMYAEDPHKISTGDINALNTQCYNAKADWDRMPFADFLPSQILLKHPSDAGMRALEIGSGTGLLALFLQTHGFEVLCLDPSEEMVRRSREKGLTTIQTTLQNFSSKEKFGLVSAVLSLIHVPKREAFVQIRKIADWLNPHGTFILALIEGKGEGIGEKNSNYPRYFSYYTRQEVLDLTQEYFQVVFEKEVKGPVSYLVFIFQKK